MSTTEIETLPHAGPPAPPPVEEARPALLAELREIFVHDLWNYRELALQLTLRDVRIRYKQAVMGLAWAVLMPALIVMAGALVRFAMAYVGGDSVDGAQIAGMAMKALPWAFFVGAIGFAVNSLTGNAALVTKIYFPREVLPLSSVMAQAVDSLIGATVLALALPFMGVDYSFAALWVLPLALLLFLFTAGAALFLGCANLFFRDVKYIVQVLLTFGIFFTPVFFEPQMFGATGAFIMMLNPLAPLLEGMRLAVVEGHDLLTPLVVAGSGDGTSILAWSPWHLAYSAAITVALLLGSALLFHRYEFVFAEYA